MDSKMINRSVLTTIIGFLFGYFLYTVIDSTSLFIFLFGGVGYFIGLILDNADRRLQLENVQNISSSHKVYYSDILPEAVILYSMLDNITIVLIDYKIEAKPEDYRLSVLKNLQEFDFRVTEDSLKTIFSLTIEFPEFNYPSISNSEKELKKFFYDIKEQCIDFQGAVQKIIPGLVLSTIYKPDIFGDQNIYSHETHNRSDSMKPPDFNSGERSSSSLSEKVDNINPSIPKISTSNLEIPELQTENEEKIMSDLLGNTSKPKLDSKSLTKSLDEKFESSMQNRPKILTADKIKEISNNLFAFQDKKDDDFPGSEKPETDMKPEIMTSVEADSTGRLHDPGKDEEGTYELVEETLDEKERPLLAKLAEQLYDEKERRSSNSDPEVDEDFRPKESSKQEI
ncbi:hypothetical protein CEE45_12805 [Candidatus Heimdallarchaeota archaeon B3_Heim]|nr:MAG: hypothetical protein CEE45_12805 [Candidatus Heimdallarchaeota archaeon B3_Heim]